MLRRVKRTCNRIIKILFILIISVLFFLIAFFIVFRPSYEVSYKGKFIGYSSNLFDLKDYISRELLVQDSDADFYELEEPVHLDFKFLKRNLQYNKSLIEDIKKVAIPVRKYYILKNKGEERGVFKEYSQAMEVVTNLDERKNINVSKLDIKLEYSREKKVLNSIDEVVNILSKENGMKLEKSSKDSLGPYSKGMSTKKVELPLELDKPLSGPVTSTFQPNRRIFGKVSPHHGTDIGRPLGTPILAAQDGHVALVGYQGAYGNMVEIDHSNELTTVYGHMSRFIVYKGQAVKKGEIIGFVGNTGRSTGAHLHFEIRLRGIAVNPELYVKFN